jgi:hypothetical protein
VGFALTEENMQLSPVTEQFGLPKSHKILGSWLKRQYLDMPRRVERMHLAAHFD